MRTDAWGLTAPSRKVMEKGGISQRHIDFANALTGWSMPATAFQMAAPGLKITGKEDPS